MYKQYIPFRTSQYWYEKIHAIVEKDGVPLAWLLRYLIELGFKNLKISDMRKRAREDGVI